jgi:hypothetical protein
MGLRNVIGDVGLSAANAGAGTLNGGAVANAGVASDVICAVHVSAVGAGAPTLAVSLQESNDGVAGWTAVPGSAVATLTAVGGGMSNARITRNFVRAVATIAGTTPDVTFRVLLLVIPD